MKTVERGRLMRGVRFESQRFRVLSIVAGCLIISATFILSSRPEANLFTDLSLRQQITRPLRFVADRTTGSSRQFDFRVDVHESRRNEEETANGGQDFHVDVVEGKKDQSMEDEAEEVHDDAMRRGGVRVDEIMEKTTTEEQRQMQETARNGHFPDDSNSNWNDAKEEAAREDGESQFEISDRRETQEGGDFQQLDKFEHEETTRNTEEKQTTGFEQPEGGVAGEIRFPTQPEQQGKLDGRGKTAAPLCNFTDFRSDRCEMAGEVRVDPRTNTVTYMDYAGERGAEEWKVRPYPRKGDELCMNRITELTVKSSREGPQCTKMHDVPGVIFSTAGYTGNVFHDFSDVIIPLFTTVSRYGGNVQFLLTDFDGWWLVKYEKVIRALSNFPIIDFRKDDQVHCFKELIISLRADKELIIEPERNPDGLTTPDFTQFIRRTFELSRDAPTRLGEMNVKPRLFLITRKSTRKFENPEEISRMAEELGFEVVVREAHVADDIVQVAQVINSCDVMLGVHGAGLTNEMFLPPNGTVVQVVLWGGLEWIARMDYGEPAIAFGLKYIQYSIEVEESTLLDKYPRDHEIFTNPFAFHRRGFDVIKKNFMDEQNVRLDVNKFRNVLMQALENLIQ